jgi:hypothetical protein
MTSDRKKPGVAFWMTVAVVVVLAYPLSFGPACWISSRIEIGRKLLSVVYRPMTAGIRIKDFQVLLADAHSRVVAEGGGLRMQPARSGLNLIDWYAKVGAADHWHWCYDVEHCPNNGFTQRWEWRKEPGFD